MRAFVLTLLASTLIVFAASAFGQSMSGRAENSAFGIAPRTQEFVTLTLQAEMLGMQSSQIALMRAESSKAKDFARRAIEDREAADELKSLVFNGQVRAIEPLFLGRKNAAQIDRLWNLQGAEFAEAYNDLQVSLQKDAVGLFERYAADGDSSELKAFAARHLPDLRQQLQRAEELER